LVSSCWINAASTLVFTVVKKSPWGFGTVKGSTIGPATPKGAWWMCAAEMGATRSATCQQTEMVRLAWSM